MDQATTVAAIIATKTNPTANKAVKALHATKANKATTTIDIP